MSIIRANYGTLRKKDFDLLWSLQENRSGFHIGNCSRVGTHTFTKAELWAELKKATRQWEAGDERAGEWASCVLSVLGLEWV